MGLLTLLQRVFYNILCFTSTKIFYIIILSNSGWGDARNDISEAVYKFYYGESDVAEPKLQMDVGYI